MPPTTAPLAATLDEPLRERFARLLAEHRAVLRRVARTYARGHADSSDLEQEIVLALWKALPDFRGECSERTFVYRVAHNRGISHEQAERVRRATKGLDEEHLTVADRVPLPDDALDHSRRRESLWAAIKTLPIGARSVLTLSLEGLPHEEIAAILGTTTNSVAVRLTYARADLRAKLGDQR